MFDSNERAADVHDRSGSVQKLLHPLNLVRNGSTDSRRI